MTTPSAQRAVIRGNRISGIGSVGSSTFWLVRLFVTAQNRLQNRSMSPRRTSSIDTRIVAVFMALLYASEGMSGMPAQAQDAVRAGPRGLSITGAEPASATGTRTRTPVITEDDIVRALAPHTSSRSLSIVVNEPSQRRDQVFLDSLRNRTSLSAEERQNLARLSADRQSFALDIPFGYNSSTIGTTALSLVKTLGAGLSRPELRDSVILIVGHTDGKGAVRANQMLSERRAETVRQYVIKNYGVPASNLISVGYGKTQLKDRASPMAPGNRRVVAINMSAPLIAKRD